MGFQRILNRLSGKSHKPRGPARQTLPDLAPPKPQVSAKLPPLFFETLEQRLLLSATPFTFTANPLVAQNLTLSIVDLIGGPTVRLTDAGTGLVLQQKLVVDTSTIAITLSNQADRITIASNFSAIGGSISGLGGTDRITGGAAGNYLITGLDTGQALGLNFSTVEGLTGSASLGELFQLNTGGAMSAGIDGAGGADTVRLSGAATTVSLQVNSSTTATLSVTSLVTRTTALSNVEVIADQTAPTTRTATGSALSEGITLSQSASTVTARFNSVLAYTFTQNAGSVTIDEGAGFGNITVTSNLTMANSALTLRAQSIAVGAFAINTVGVSSQGSISLVANAAAFGVAGTIDGLSASILTGNAQVTLNGSTLRAGSIAVQATTTLNSTATANTLALAGANATATITATGATLTATAGNVTMLATTSMTVRATATAVNGTTDAGIDAAIAMALARNSTTVTLTNTDVTAGGNILVRSRNLLTMATNATGATGVGAVVAASFIEGATAVNLAGTGAMSAGGTTDLTAQHNSIVTTTATGGTGGAEANGGTSQGEQTLADSDARTSEGAFPVAAAVALTKVDRTADVTLSGKQSLSTTNGTRINSQASDNLSTRADASGTKGNVAAAAAINLVSSVDRVNLLGQITVKNAGLAASVDEFPTATSLSAARALSGASSTKVVGVAGALALNTADADRVITVGSTANLDVTGDLSLIIGGNSNDIAEAQSGAVGGAPVGIGASVALNLLDRDTLIEVQTGAGMTAAAGGALLQSDTQGTATTQALAGAAGGTALTPAFAMTQADGDNLVVVEAGTTLAVTTGLRMLVERDETINTEARGTAQGTSASVGGAVALTVGLQDTQAILRRDAAATFVVVQALLGLDATTRAVASTSGGRAPTTGGMTADTQAASATDFATAESGETVDTPSAQTPQGGVGVAAALGLSVQKGSTQAVIDAGASVQAGSGAVQVTARADVDAAVVADGSVVTATPATRPNVGVGAAVALNLADLEVLAEVRGKVVGNLTIEASVGDAADISSAGVSTLTTSAIAGAGAARFGLAGSFALTDDNLDARASVAAGASVNGSGLTVLATSKTNVTTTASAAASLGSGGSGVGIGLGVAIGLLDADAVAEVAGAADLGVGNLTMSATTVHVATTTAGAGSSGGSVAAVPSVALTVSQNDASVSLPAGGALLLSGDVNLTSSSTLTATTVSKSAAAGSTAAVGVSLALTSAEDTATTEVARSLDAAGAIALGAVQLGTITTRAFASAAGVKNEGAAGPQSADDQAGDATDFAATQGATTGGAGSAQSANGKFGLSAALALGFVSGGASAHVAAGAVLHAGTTLQVVAEGDMDAVTLADASVVKAEGGDVVGVGIGAAVAISMVDRSIAAEVDGAVTGDVQVQILADMAVDGLSTNRNTIETTAVSGVGAGDVAVSGAFAMTSGGVAALAEIGATGAATAGSKGLEVSAESLNDFAATASADATLGGSGGTGVGIGAGVALVLSDNTATAQVAGGAGSATGQLVMHALVDTIARGKGAAGAANGSVAIAPSVFVAVDNSAARALLDAGADASFGDLARIEAINIHSVDGKAASAASAATAALGVTVALSVDNAVAEAVVARKLTALGDVTLLSSLRSDIVLSAVASTKGVSQGTSGAAGSTADAQVSQQQNFAGDLGGTTGATPSVQSSGGAFGLAASLALSVIGGGAVARVTTTGVLQSNTGNVTVQALGDVDSNVTADSSVVKGTAGSDPNVGVGAAVALNVATRTTRALIEGTVSAAKSVTVQAGMATEPDGLNRSILLARAVAGAGATTAAVSGAFAMNANGLSADATPAGTAQFSAVAGGVSIRADNQTAISAIGSANAALGQGATGVGVGVGIAINLLTGSAKADLPGTVAVTGGGLSLTASSDHIAAGLAGAGATAGTVGVAPSVLLQIDQSSSSANMASGVGLVLSGPVSVSALGQTTITGTARSAGSGSTAGLGVSVALSIVTGTTTAIVNRGITTTGDISVTARQRNDVSINAIASASGVSTSTSGAATPEADSQIGNELTFADTMGGPSGLTAPSAASSGGKFGLAAAIGLSIVGGTVEARLASGGSLTSTAGSVRIEALQDVDSAVNADGSTVTGNDKSQPNIGVGAAVAINAINRTALAFVNGDINGATGVTVNAGMALDPATVNRSVITAKAVSGVGAGNVGVSGSFALNQVNLDATPVIGAGRTITAGGAGTTLQATTITTANATASAAASLGVSGSTASGVGVGGAVALNLLDSDSLIAPPATAKFAGAGLVLNALGDHIATGLAQAGAKGGDVSVAPAVYLVASTNTAEARLEGGSALNLTGDVALLASEKTEVSGTANSAATAGTAAIGVTLSLAVMENSATARLARDVTTTGAVTLRATRADSVKLLSTASAAGLTSGASGGDTKADEQIGREVSFTNSRGGTSGAADPLVATDSAGTAKSVGIAAALSLSVMTGDSLAEVALGTTVNAGGLVTVAAEADSDSSTTADAKTVSTAVGIGAAVALNVISQDNSALVAGSVASNGLTISATGLADDKEPLNSFVARAVSGAGASNVGVSGAFALNIETLTTTALLAGRASEGLTGDVTITGFVATNSTATGSSKAINDATGSTSTSTSVGVGLSFGMNLVNNDVTAGLADGSRLTGGRDVTIAATGIHASTTKAAAGSGGSVGVSPSLALLVSGNEARAILGTGTALNIAGDLSSKAQQSHLAVLDADASATGDRVAVGAAVALAILPELATASPARNVTAAGDITLSSDLVTGVTSTTLASTRGVTSGGSGPSTADGQSGNLINFANSEGGSTATAPNAAQVGGSGGSQSVGVAAALALNIVTGRALTLLDSSLTLTAGGAVSLLSRLDLDAEAEGDGSSAQGSVGVGVGVALNVVTGQNLAQVKGQVVAGGNVTVSAIMSPQGDGTDVLLAKANAGVAGSKIGVAGAFAMNISNITTLANVSGATSAGGILTVEAAAKSTDRAEAISAVSDRAGGERAGQVGVGAAVAINILNDDETADIAAGVPLTAGAGLVIKATGDHQGSALAQAGSAGDISVAPALALNIVTDQTVASLGAGNAVVSTGVVEVSASHKGIYSATADAEAGGKDVAVGAAVALNVLVDSALATIARNVAAGGTLTLKSQNQVAGFAQAKGSANGNSGGGSDADTQADQSVNNNAAITSRSGPLDVGEAQPGVDQGTAESSAAAGGRGPGGVGVGAAIAINTIVTSSKALVADGVTLAAGGDLGVLSSQEVDAAANAQGTALKPKGTNIGAALALNVVTADNLAVLGVGAKLLGDGSVRVQALDLVTDKGNQTNDLTTRAIAGAGGDQAAVAASLAVNIANFNTRAVLGDGSVTVARGGALRVQAQASFTAQNVAGGGAVGLSSAASVGAAAVVNIFNASTLALVDGASADAGGQMVISATTSYVPKTEQIVLGAVNVTSVAGGGAVTTGNAAIGGSVVVDIINISTKAEIADATEVNQAGLPPLPSQTVGLLARTTLTTFSAAGGVGAALGSAGIGAGVTVGVINDTTLARIGSNVEVSAKGGVALLATSGVTRTGTAIAVGAAGTAGIGGAVVVDVYNSSTRALIDTGTVVDSGDRVSVSALDNDQLTGVAGSVGGGGTAGVGVGLLTMIHNDVVEALLADDTTVTTRGGMAIRATSNEVLTGTAVAGAGAATAGVAASPVVLIANETTSGRIGQGATVTGIAEAASVPDIFVAAVDTTKTTVVAGSVAITGSAGVGAGLDATTLTKVTEATVGARSNITTAASLDIRAGSREDMTSLVMTAAVGGSVAVNGSVSVIAANITTRAFIEGTETVVGRTTVDAGNNVIVQAVDSSEYDLFVGGLGVSGGTSAGASVSVPVVNKLTEAFIGTNAAVTGRANGAAGSTLGGFTEDYRPVQKSEPEVVTGAAGSGDLPIGQDEQPGGPPPGGSLVDTNGDPVDPSFTGNDDAAQVLQLSTSALSVRGVAVVALTSDDLGQFALTGGASGAVAVAVSGDVTIFNVRTSARIESFALINKAAGVHGASQDVVVLAGSEFFGLTVAGAVSVAGNVAVSPSVAVVVLNEQTEALILGGADVAAQDSVALKAFAHQQYTAVVAGVSVSGVAAVGGSVGVLQLTSTTRAHIGDIGDTGSDLAATVTANRDVLVQAIDDTEVVTFQGQAAVSGTAAVGASVGVASLVKNTSAQIAAGSRVTARGAASGGEGLGLFPVDGRFDDGKLVSGLSVLAGASETIEALAFTGAIGPAGAGVAGAVSIALIDSDVLARIGADARINQGVLGGLGQDVRVMAENEVDGLGGSGGLGGGAVGIAGAFTIGVVRNAVEADIAAGTTILAGGTVKVTARSNHNITSFAASAGVGGGAAALSFAIWVIGGEFGSGGGSASETEWAGTYQGHANGGVVSGGYSSALGASKPFTFGGVAVNPTNNTILLTGNGLRTGDAVVYRSNGANIGGLVDGQTYYVIANSATPNQIRLASSAANASGGFAIDLTASTGAGATLSMVDTALSDTAIRNQSLALQAGGPTINLSSALDDDPASQGTYAHIGERVVVNAVDGLRISAADVLKVTQVTGNIAVGGVAVGASFGVLVHDQPVTAFVGDGSQIAVSGFGLALRAFSIEEITQIAVGAAVGSGGDVSGSATINVLTETTRASLGQGVQVQTVKLAGAKAQPDVEIVATDDTTISDIAGAASFSAAAGVGVGLDVVTLTKTTTAQIGEQALIEADGSVILRALSTEDMGSLSVTGSGAGGVAIAGSASVLVLNTTSLALIEGSRLAGDGSVIVADGNVVVEAADDNRIDIFAGAFTIGLAAALGGGAAVPVVTRVARAEIGDNTTVTGRGLLGTDVVRDGTYRDTFTAPGIGDVVSGAVGGGSTGYDDGKSTGSPPGGDGRQTSFDDTFDGTAGAGQVHGYLANTINGKGVLVSATSSDDIATLGVSGGISGGLAVNFSGVVSSLTSTTTARIGDATINPVDSVAPGAGQDVMVMAGSDFTGLSVAAGISGGGIGAVAPSAAVSFIGLTTTALIDAGAEVRAQDGVRVNAFSHQVISFVGAGGAAAGVFAFGATSGVVSLKSATMALIGKGAVVLTEGSLRVGATDDTQITGIVGAVGGAGIAGAGASAQVVVIQKDTLAMIDENAQVEALGHADQSAITSVLDGVNTRNGGLTGIDVVRGIVVEAKSSEDLSLLAIAAGVGLGFGFGGAVNVAVVDSDTSALIGANATVSAGDATAAANVRVIAGNDFTAFMHTGAGALGTAGLAGALSVGILRNGVLAQIGTGAEVTAAGNIAVRGLSARDIRGFTVAAGGGIGAAAGSVSVWNLGGLFNSSYSYGETDVNGTTPENQTLSNTTRSEDSLAGSDWQTDQDNLLLGRDTKDGTGWEDILNGRSLGSGGSSSRVDFIVGQGHGAVAADGPDASVSGSLANAGSDIEGTTAQVTNATTLSAGGNLDVRAEDLTLFDGVAGGVVVGVGAFGASISILNSDMDVTARIQGSAGAGGTLDVIAKSTADTGNYAVMGSGGLIVLGAQVAVTTDNSARLATVSGGTLTSGGAGSVQAIRDADHQAQALGVTALSALSGGVSVGMVKMAGSTEARSTSTWSDSSAPGGSTVTVSATTDTSIEVQSWGVGIGLLLAVNGAVAWGEDASTVAASASGAQDMAGRIDVVAQALSGVEAKAVAGTGSLGGALSAAVAVAKLNPTVTATAALTGTIGAATALAAFNADAATGDEISGYGAQAVAWSFGAALIGVAAAGAIAVTDVRPVISASNSSTAADRAARAFGALTANSSTAGFAGGLVGFGAGVAFATVAGSITATVSGAASGTVVVSTIGHLNADADTQAVSGGLLVASVNFADATVSTAVSSTLTGTLSATGPGVVDVQSRADGHAVASTRGTSIGLIAGTGPAFLGGSVALADFAPTVRASSRATINGSNSVTVDADVSGEATAVTGGSGNDSPGPGSITIGLLASFGGFADARQRATATAELGGRVTSSGIIRVDSSATTEAQSSTTDLGIGLLTFGISFSHATNLAQSTTNILAGARATGAQVLLSSTGAHYAKAAGNSAAGGLIGGVTAVDVLTSMTTSALTNIAEAAQLTATGQIQAITRNASEGDGEANATVGGVLFAGGATSGIMTLTTSSQTTVDAGARIVGGSVTLQAFGGTTPLVPATNFTYTQNAGDLTSDVIRITNHGLITGQTVQLGTTTTNSWADPDRVYTVLTTSDPNSFRLGASFDAAQVNASRDEITFAAPHGFLTGDKVIYSRGSSLSIINGVAPASLFVLVVNDTTIKLLDYDPSLGLRGAEFDGGDVNATTDQIAITAHGFTTGQMVTFNLPQAVTFNAGVVDLNAAADAIVDSRNTIILNNHQFQTGDAVTYTIRQGGVSNAGTRLSGLTTGTQYFAIRLDDNTIRLATTKALALAGTAIEIDQPTSTATSRSTEHILTPQSGAIGGLVDGRAYRVQVVNANAIQLKDAVTGSVINLLASATGGSSALVREGIDLLARSGTQSVYIDMVGGISGSLQGPGGQSLNDAVLAQGDGRSRLVVNGFAIGAGGISANNADITVNSTVRVVIDAGSVANPTLVQALTGNVVLLSENRFDAVVSATAGAGGFFASGSSASSATFNVITETRIGALTAKGVGNTNVIAAGTINATASQITNGAANAFSTGVAGLAFADADATVNSTHSTLALIGAGAVLQGANIAVTAKTAQSLSTTMEVNAYGGGASANAGMAGGGTIVLPASATLVQVATDAALLASNALTLLALINGSSAKSTASTDSVAAGADSQAQANVQVSEKNQVLLDSRSGLQGLGSVTLAARVNDYSVSSTSDANLTAFGGYTNSRALATGTVANSIVGTAGSLVRTPKLLVDVSVDAGRPGLVKSLRATGSSFGFIVNDRFETPAGSQTKVTNTITFNSNVDLLRRVGSDVVLVINAAGVVTTATNATVEGGNGVGFDADGDGQIVVDTIGLDADGEALFKAGAGGVVTGTGGVWTVFKGPANVTITNQSGAKLVLGSIDTAFGTLNTAAGDVDVDIQVGDADDLKFDIVTKYDTTASSITEDQKVTVTSVGTVAIAGIINNPLGQVSITSTAGSIIRGNKSGQIITKGVVLNAALDIGENPTAAVTNGKLSVVFVKAGSRTPTASFIAGRDIFLTGFAVQRDTTATRPNVVITNLTAGRNVDMTLTDTELQTVLPATHVGGIVVTAVASVANNAPVPGGSPISTTQFYREFYYPNTAGGTASPDTLGVFGIASGVKGSATWTVQSLSVGGTRSITAAPGTAVTINLPAGARMSGTAMIAPEPVATTSFVDLGGMVAASTLAAKAGLDESWTTDTAKRGVIDWTGAAA